MPSGSAAKPPPPGTLVLVVEDEFLIAMDLEYLLRRHGLRVLGPAATVAEAFRLLEVQTPDVALLDVNVGGDMVVPVAELLQARGVPFVLSSAYDSAHLAEILVGAPSVGKPASAQRLLAALACAVCR